MKKPKSKREWFKKNIVIVPVVAAIIAGTFTSVRYVLSLTDTEKTEINTFLKYTHLSKEKINVIKKTLKII